MKFRRPLCLAVVVTASGALFSACSDDANVVADDGIPVIEVTMVDLAFSPSSVEIAAGETVRFRFNNTGAAIHDAVIGDLEVQEHHASGMAEGTAEHGSEDEPTTVVVAPGETGEILYTADAPGTLIIGCHQPGHWDAGMKAALTVT